jgi:hypothetical protein
VASKSGWRVGERLRASRRAVSAAWSLGSIAGRGGAARRGEPPTRHVVGHREAEERRQEERTSSATSSFVSLLLYFTCMKNSTTSDAFEERDRDRHREVEPSQVLERDVDRKRRQGHQGPEDRVIGALREKCAT